MTIAGAPAGARSVAVFIPDLFGAKHPGAASSRPVVRPPALERLLACAARGPLPLPGSRDAALFRLFGAAVPAAGDLPVAAITRIHDGGALDRDWWIRADPVCLEPHGDGLVLHAGEALQLSLPEARELAAPITREFAVEGWRLDVGDALRWYLRPRDPPADLACTPLAAVIGRDIGTRLPRGADGAAWRRRLNETQLLLNPSPVNEHRHGYGARPINSLWFWGGGQAPERGSPGWRQVWTSEPVAGGLARLAGIPVQSVPETFDGVLGVDGGAALVVWGPGSEARPQDFPSWRERIEELERHWFAPMVEALRHRRLAAVVLWTEGCSEFRVTPGDLRRWWRRRRPLDCYRSATDG